MSLGGQVDPAQKFLDHHQVNAIEDIEAYAQFLREEAGIVHNIPINLDQILAHFGLKSPIVSPSLSMDGLLVGYQIFVNANSIRTRQRFTTAHELMELLIGKLPKKQWLDGQNHSCFGSFKEYVCQRGAAELLMPKTLLLPMLRDQGISFLTMADIANLFDVSLMASLIRVPDLIDNQTIVVLWRMKNKPSELQQQTPSAQATLPGFGNISKIPPKKLRVEWSYGSINHQRLWKDKSIDPDSSVYTAWNKNNFSESIEILNFGRQTCLAQLENKTIEIENEKYVVSLIHKQ